VQESLIVVDGLRPAKRARINLRDEKEWAGIALDQRAFGPARLLVAFAKRSGRLVGLAHAPRWDPPEPALDACIQHMGRGAAACIAYNDERVDEGAELDDIADRFGRASAVAARHGIHLVDWISCDDLWFRSSRLALFPDEPWWRMP
jgi:hypothetical protein